MNPTEWAPTMGPIAPVQSDIDSEVEDYIEQRGLVTLAAEPAPYEDIDYTKPLPSSSSSSVRQAPLDGRILITLMIQDRRNYMRKDLVSDKLIQVLENVMGSLQMITPAEQDIRTGTVSILATSRYKETMETWCNRSKWRIINEAIKPNLHVLSVDSVAYCYNTVAGARASLLPEL